MSENLNAAMIEQMQQALDQTRVSLSEVEKEYNRLRAQVVAYEQAIHNLKAIEDGQYQAVGGKDGTEAPPKVRKDSHALKEHIHEYFKARSRIVQSPKGLSKWLVEEKGWDEERLRTRISNLLRKIVKEEPWLDRAGHGKYMYQAD